ncbi:hypothetical protein GH714_020862 [Hevea brasiliensis]|uniref:Uncharacterized protein n=1 Tax=Hevea brasiliensis TaxID=3981 RepID=A0A6A6M281_HEVBR|nr:hypothetical protein GH714_020862 [Hevea brasiliensis]
MKACFLETKETMKDKDRIGNSNNDGKSSPFEDENGLKKGPWTPEEDKKLIDYIQNHGHGSWRALPKLAGLNRPLQNNSTDPTHLAKPAVEQFILQVLSSSPFPNMEAAATNLLGSSTIYEYLRMNSQLEGLLSSSGQAPGYSLSPQDITRFLPNFPNLEAHQPPLSDEYHPLKDSKIGSNNNGQLVCDSYGASTSNPLLPPLVSASPDDHCPTMNRKESCSRMNPNDISNPSSTSTTFEAWGDLMDDEASDIYWREIIDQASSQPWPMSE